MNRLSVGFCLGVLVSFGSVFAQTPTPDLSASPSPAASAKATSTPVQETYAEAPPIGGSKLGYSSVYVDGPYIALTFDDGPGPFTAHLLDILKQKNVKATFFLVGECAQEFPDLVRREVEEGHEVANHSFSHSNYQKMSDAAVRADLDHTSEVIKQASGHQVALMRPPYGAISPRQKEWITKDLGLKVILWSVDPLDWKNRNSAIVESRILANTGHGAIVLSHDIHKTTVDAMADTIDQLQARGYKFVTVSELIAMEKPRPVPTATPAATAKSSAAPQTASTKASSAAAHSKKAQ